MDSKELSFSELSGNYTTDLLCWDTLGAPTCVDQNPPVHQKVLTDFNGLKGAQFQRTLRQLHHRSLVLGYPWCTDMC